MNKWNFTGNLGNPAEQRFTADGKSIVSFSVAVKAGYGDKATTTWAKCSMFGKSGEGVLQYLNKGTLVGIVGEVSLRPWKDKEGVEKQSLEVRVNDLTLLSKSDAAPKAAEKPSSDHFDDSLPF